MKKAFLSLSLAALLLPACQHIDNIEQHLDTHIIIDDEDEISVIPGVLAEKYEDKIVLEFDDDVDEDILDLLSLTDYTETMPAVLPESLPGVTFTIDPEDDSKVIVDVSKLDRTIPRPATLIYNDEDAPVLAHMMLVKNSSCSMLESRKSYSAVISDIHLNDARSIKNGWSWCKKNQSALIGYIDNLIEKKEQYRELVLLGDVIDEYVTPVPYATFARPDGTVVTEKEYFRLIADANRAIFDKFKELQSAGIKLIFVPGNHDCGLDADDVHELFGPDAVFVSDVRGLGSYVPEYASEITMEHGHRYDVMCAPDMLSNIGKDNVTKDNAFLGAQYFVTRIAATHDYLAKKTDDNIGRFSLEDLGIDEEFVREATAQDGESSDDDDEFNLFVTRAVWNVIGLAKDVPGLDTLAIPTGVSGLTGKYVASQYSYLGVAPEPELYKSMYVQSEWEQRLKCNNAPSGFPFLLGSIMCEVPYMDMNAVSWIAKRDNDHRIFIWAHTHNPVMTAERFDGRAVGYIYANTGSWVDDGVSRYSTRSFVNLYFGKDGYIQVCLKQLCEDGSVRNIDTPLWLKK